MTDEWGPGSGDRGVSLVCGLIFGVCGSFKETTQVDVTQAWKRGVGVQSAPPF